MKLVKNISEIPRTGKPVVLAMGCFDGVHIGHQKVISTAIEQARDRGGEAWVYTFDPHPAKVLVPHRAPPLISAKPSRLRRFEALCVQGVIERPFTLEFAKLSPAAFLEDLCRNASQLSGIVCGQDWSFGYRASGNFQTLETFGQKHGFTATAVSPVMDGDHKVSSTTIRKAVSEGDIPRVEKLLGRPFSLFGTVVDGHHIGRKLGFPTANIAPLNELLPPPGVYAAYTLLQESETGDQKSEAGGQKSETGDQRSETGDQRSASGLPPTSVLCPPTSDLRPLPSSVLRPPTSDLQPLSSKFPSAVFIGKRKTFGGHEPVIESYLLDFDSDLYGQELEICLVKKIRDVFPFPSKEALIEQIKEDVAQIRMLLNQT